jgi:hypothetical protein
LGLLPDFLPTFPPLPLDVHCVVKPPPPSQTRTPPYPRPCLPSIIPAYPLPPATTGVCARTAVRVPGADSGLHPPLPMCVPLVRVSCSVLRPVPPRRLLR